jgi:hypothetical protein
MTLTKNDLFQLTSPKRMFTPILTITEVISLTKKIHSFIQSGREVKATTRRAPRLRNRTRFNND